jgi:hypothetical protein
VVVGLLRLGDDERALALMAQGITTDDAGLAFRLFSPQGRHARTLPGFQVVAEKIGWIDAWEKYGPPDLCTRTAPRVYACR